MPAALLFIAHGSPRLEANQFIMDLCQDLEASSGKRVAPCFLTGKPISIPEAFQILIQEGFTEVLALPYFLAPGDHTQKDIPEIIAALANSHPHMSLKLLKPFGLLPETKVLMADVIKKIS